MNSIGNIHETARRNALTWFLRAERLDPRLILDFETAGNADFKAGIFPEAVSVALINGRGGFELHTLIKPLNAVITKEASDINGITEDMLVGAPSFADIYPQLLEQMAGRVVITYNVKFDKGVFLNCCQLAGIQPPKIRFECAMEAYASYNGDYNVKFKSYKWKKLTDAYERVCGADDILANAHDALADVKMTNGLIIKLAEVAKNEGITP